MFDVDCTVIGVDGTLRPGIVETFAVLRVLGCEIALWTGAGYEHAQRVRAEHGLDVDYCLSKPSYPIHASDALDVLGRPAALILDDDESEAVEGWPFLRLDPWWGSTWS